MGILTSDAIKRVKQKGFLRNRGSHLFSGRVVSAGGVYSAEQLTQIAACAHRFGNGKVAFTSRLSAEIVGIPYEKIDDACRFLRDAQLSFGGTGARIRPITACKGTTCVFGCCDTQGLAQQLHERYYIGQQDVQLPHKFKIAVGGCANSCMKPSLNDFGIEARRDGKNVLFQIYVGGMWGRQTRVGTALSQQYEQREIAPILDNVLQWYKMNALNKERLGVTIDRIGIQHLEDRLGVIPSV